MQMFNAARQTIYKVLNEKKSRTNKN